MQEINHSSNPFPGLRPFEATETHLFFGRDGQSEELLRRLKRTRFLAVVGTSGSGKSSLVRAGLLPALQGGLMTSAGSDWRIAILRPGNDPIGNLARALSSPMVLSSRDAKSAGMQEVLAETTLRRSSLGLAELVSRARTKLDEGGQPLFQDYENLLIVVDQFEEIFRFKQLIEEENSKEDAAAFVKLLLEAIGQPEGKIYVVLTMRSDFLGDCAQFQELPEAINDGQYLIPRMTRDERREAITGPVAVGEGAISEPLVNQLLNDVGDNPDQLPIMQHTLMRTWDYWLNRRRNGEPMDIPDYEATGGMSEALSRHADEAYAELSDAQKVIAEKLFKGLTERGADNREIRRPMEVQEICELTGASEAEVIAVIEVFRREGRSFLMPPPTDALTDMPVPLSRESLIDISHESLIRNWARLKMWVNEESRSARIYGRLAETAVLHKEGGAGLWRDPDLQIALTWREDGKPNKVWARRYHPEFALAMSFLDESVAARDAQIARDEARRKKEIKRTRLTAVILGLAFLSSVVMGIFAYIAKDKAESAGAKAAEQKLKAEAEAEKSRRLLYMADMNVAGQEYERGNFARGSELLEAYLPDPGQQDLRGYEWYFLWRLYHKERATFRGHTEKVYSVAYSPDGKTLATVSGDGTAKLWDIASQRELATFKGHTDRVNSVAYSPDGKMLATGGWDNVAKLWDIASGQELATLTGHTAKVYSMAFSPDGKTLATASWDNRVKLWDIASRQELTTLSDHTEPVLSVAFSPDGRTLATASMDKTTKLWDTASYKLLDTLTGSTRGVSCVAYSPDGRTLATCYDWDQKLALWDIASRKVRDTLEGVFAMSAAFSPDGKTLAIGSDDGTINIWDTVSRKLVTLKGHADGIYSVAFAPDGKTFATASWDQTAKLWDAIPRQGQTILKGYAVAFLPDGKTLATVSGDGTVILWDTTTGQMLDTLKGVAGRSLAFSPDGKTLAAISGSGTLKLLDIASHEALYTLEKAFARSVAFSPDGKTLVIGAVDSSVKLLDTTSYQVRDIPTPTGVAPPAFSPDGKMLAVASSGKVELWDSTSAYSLGVLKLEFPSLSLAFSPDGKMLAIGSYDKTVKLWNLTSFKSIALPGHTEGVMAVAFSPDGKTLVTGSRDKTVKLWDVATHWELITLKKHEGAVSSIAFSPDGKTLATGSMDKTVRLWQKATDE